jgi:hypothetical protein
MMVYRRPETLLLSTRVSQEQCGSRGVKIARLDRRDKGLWRWAQIGM